MMCRFLATCLVVFLTAAPSYVACAGTSVCLFDGGDDGFSYVYPSIEATGVSGQYNISYVKVQGWHDPNEWSWQPGELHTAQLTLDESGGCSIQDTWTTPVNVGIGGGYNTFNNWTRPRLGGGVIAVPRFMEEPYGIEYHNLSTGQGGMLLNPPGSQYDYGFNPSVAPSGNTILYVELEWGMVIANIGNDGDSQGTPIDTGGLPSAGIMCKFDIWDNPDGTNGRFVWINGVFSGYGTYSWDGSNYDCQFRGQFPEHYSAPYFSNCLISSDYVVLQSTNEDLQPVQWAADDRKPGPMQIFKWNGNDYMDTCTFIDGDWMPESGLFGKYLVYTNPDGSRVMLCNLDTGEDRVIVESADRHMFAPAIWVDENTGEYIVLYQSSASPADLMMSTGTITTVPDPSPALALAVGLAGLIGLRMRRTNSGRDSA